MKICDVLFCDDIRDELNNKISLMGLYTDQMVFNAKNEPKWPLPTRLSVLLRFAFEKPDEYPTNFEFEFFVNDKLILKLKGNIKVDANSSYANLVINTEGIPLELGYLGFSIKLLKEEATLLLEERKQALKILIR